MPDEIDLGDGVTAEFFRRTTVLGGESFRLTDALLEDPIDLSVEAARKFCRFIDEKLEKEQP